MTTHRIIQIGQMLDKSTAKAESLLRGISNLKRIGNHKGAEFMLQSAEQWTRIAGRCKRLIERDKKQRDQLKWAISKWRECADGVYGTDAYKDSCERTAQALTLELQTGKPHCNCCLKPSDKCPYRIGREQ